MAKMEFQGLTKRTRDMLASNENLKVDFKREPSGVKSSDFVAFANANGGTLLIGVDEYTADNGMQRGRVVGCSIDDKARLALINKALECTPSIDVQVFTENIKRLAMLRIEILPNQSRPFCNSRGEYSVRDNGRNRALYPSELLNIFLESESELFYRRFQSVASDLENQVKQVNCAINDDLSHVSHSIENFEGQLNKAFSRIGKLTDSSKKRTRSVLQNVKDNQLSLVNLERVLDQDTSAQLHADHFEVLVEKLDKLAAMLRSNTENK